MYTITLLKCSVNISKTDKVPRDKTVKNNSSMGIYMEMHKSAKVWATPMLQLILKNDKVSRSFKMIRQIIPQFTSKIWEGSQAESGWVSFRLNHYGRIAHWIRGFLDFKHILNACRVNALYWFEDLEDNTFESWVQHGGWWSLIQIKVRYIQSHNHHKVSAMHVLGFFLLCYYSVCRRSASR